MVDPQTLLLTGLTRDGVYLVEDGEVVGAVNNFRFNESPVDLLGRITEVGATERCCPREWGDYFTRTAMPPVRVPDFNMSHRQPGVLSRAAPANLPAWSYGPGRPTRRQPGPTGGTDRTRSGSELERSTRDARSAPCGWPTVGESRPRGVRRGGTGRPGGSPGRPAAHYGTRTTVYVVSGVAVVVNRAFTA